MESSLKNCPFCGHMVSLVHIYESNTLIGFGTNVIGYKIRCNMCRAEMQARRRSDLMKSWNRRAYE